MKLFLDLFKNFYIVFKINYIIVVYVFVNFIKYYFKMLWILGNLYKIYVYFYNGYLLCILVY